MSNFSFNSFVENILVASIQVVATCIAAVVIDRAGRRIMLLGSSFFMFLAQVALGTYFWLSIHNPATAKTIEFLPLLSLCVFITFFSVGFGPVPWLMMGELFSPEAKGKCGTITGKAVPWDLI